MRNVLLFGSFLWFRSVVLWILWIVLFLLLVLYFMGNSSLVAKKAVEALAPDYNLTYDAIEGNVLTGFEIINPRYNHKSIAQKVVLHWNPNTLADREIKVNRLHLKKANVDVIRAMISHFASESHTKEEQNSSSEPLGITIELKDIKLSTEVFEIQGVSVEAAKLQCGMIHYEDGHLNIEGLYLDIESNLSNIVLQGSYENQVISLTKLTLLDTNLTAVMAMVKTDNTTTQEQTKTSPPQKNSLLPTSVFVDNIEISLTPYIYNSIKITDTRLWGNHLEYDIENKILKKVNFDLNSTTNLSQIDYHAAVIENQLFGTLVLKPKKELYTEYNIPLRKEAITQIIADLKISKKEVVADISLAGKQILQAKEGALNVDIDTFTSHVIYDINSSKVTADTKAHITTPYAKDIILSNQLRYKKSLEHKGEIYVSQIEGVDAKLVQPLEDFVIEYNGTQSSIETHFKSKNIKGYFYSKDFKMSHAHIETKESLALATLVALPPKLQDATVDIVVDAPINLKDFSQIDAKVQVLSNLVNMDTVISYAEEITVEGSIVIPKDSLIKVYNKDIVWDTLSPMDTKLRLKEKQFTLDLDAQAFQSHLTYGINSGRLNGKINFAGLGVDISGNTNDTLVIKSTITSLKDLGDEVRKIYPIGELPPLEGVIDASIDIDKFKNMALSLRAPKLIYQAERNTKHIINDISLVVSMQGDSIDIKSYNVVFNKQKYFSSRTANIKVADTIDISHFWINDELKIEGAYTPAIKRGDFKAEASSFHIKDKVANLNTKINLGITMDGNDTHIEGKMVLLKGDITPQVEGRSFATDSDIVFTQEMKHKKKSPFMDNLTLMIKIETQTPLQVKQKGLHIKLKPDFIINKEKKGKILYLGSVDLMEGGSYIFQEKRFVLEKSAVYFTGDVHKPLLDIKAKYKALNHLITIIVTGTPAEPNIHFSSSPSLTREQILSVILFDSEAGGDTHSGSEMMRMMGGAMAKAALSDVGVKVDHLAFGEGNSIEVGKKLNAKTMVIYINGEIPKVKLKYQHGKHTESIIGVSEESQSYDIVYKKDF